MVGITHLCSMISGASAEETGMAEDGSTRAICAGPQFFSTWHLLGLEYPTELLYLHVWYLA